MGEGTPPIVVRSTRAPAHRTPGAGASSLSGGFCMDRKQLVVERTRTVFAERLDDVLHLVRQDRQDLRGWEEPAHVRAVLRRGVRETAEGDGEADVAVLEG